jgi:glycosyltransferase involved in cell wall biosynthesis
MGARKRIGLVLNFNANWTGGVYYILNIIGALKRLPDSEQPTLVIFYNKKELVDEVTAIGYEHTELLPFKRAPSLWQRITRKLGLRTDIAYRSDIVDFAFPFTSVSGVGGLSRVRKIYWIPDFQHKHLPSLFDAQELSSRDRNFSEIARSGAKLVLSSGDAAKDFETYYHDSNVDLRVMRFASVLPDFSNISFEDLRDKFSIPARFFFAPNQFWIHKNHIVVLRSVVELKSRGVEGCVLLTGREYEPRNPDYAAMLKRFVRENDLERNVFFLGFIERRYQLALMKQAIAVIQPSKFEGWSTVIEDAKAMNQALIVSTLEVHKEQCGDQAFYFQPDDHHALAGHMETHLSSNVQSVDFGYEVEVLRYADEIMNL